MKNRLNWLEVALLLAPFIALALLWQRIPAQVPVHWNVYGEIDGWASKTIGLLITPLIGLFIVGLLHILAWVDPKLRKNFENTGRMKNVLQILGVVFAGFFDAIFAVQIAAALDRTIPAGQIIVASTLILLAILGNYFGNLRPNYFVGLRTPWTLEDPETWRATHRLGGRLLFFGALLLLVLEFFLSQSAFNVVFMTSLGLLVAWSFLYSWYHFRTHASTRETA